MTVEYRREALENDYNRVSLGVKPSGPLHLGNAATLLNGVLALQRNPRAVLYATVMDLDFDRQRGRDFVSFQRNADPYGCHGLMKEHTEEEMTVVLQEMTRFAGVDPSRIDVSFFSEYTSDPRFQEYMRTLFLTMEGRRILSTTILNGTARARTLISPICDSCGHSSIIAPHLMAGEILSTDCFNGQCSTGRYYTGLTEPGRVNIFYLVDPVRDLVPDKRGFRADLHIFGGDYGEPYGLGWLPKSERVLALLSELSVNPPTIFVGPLFVCGGVRLGKSKRNGDKVEELRASHSNWLERLYDLVAKSSGPVELLEEKALH